MYLINLLLACVFFTAIFSIGIGIILSFSSKELPNYDFFCCIGIGIGIGIFFLLFVLDPASSKIKAKFESFQEYDKQDKSNNLKEWLSLRFWMALGSGVFAYSMLDQTKWSFTNYPCMFGLGVTVLLFGIYHFSNYLRYRIIHR